MTTGMAADVVADRRAILRASRSRWSGTDRFEIGKCNEDVVQHWLTSISNVMVTNTTSLLREETKPEVALETTVKNDSKDDDLALGVEASLYGKCSHRTVRSFLSSLMSSTYRSSQDLPALSRWNSFASVLSTQSEVSVMDVLNMLQDDPEELLLDLGFGVDEPDLTGRIPVRFLSYQSNARGISFQVFLDAQQSRIDVENPDVRSRFRQLEVLQQVTSTFTNLVGSEASSPAQLSTEAREKRKRIATILRRAAKKTLSQAQKSQDMPPPVTSAQSGPESSPDKRMPPKRTKLSDNNLSPLEEEQSIHLEAAEPVLSSSVPRVTAEPLKLNSVPSSSRKGTREPLESFELEEIQSFDEGNVPGNCSGPVDPGGDHLVSYVIRTNSCQSDSSGFLEEPFIPALSQQSSPGSELMKMLNGISHEDIEPQTSKTHFSHKDFSSIHSINSVLETADLHNTVDSHTVLGTADSAQPSILPQKANSDSSSPDISNASSNSVYTLAYFVQMDPTGYQTEIRDILQNPNQPVCKQSVSLFEELKSAETVSRFAPTDLRTGVVATFTNPHEVGEQVLSSGTLVPEKIQESPASIQDQNVTSDGAIGRSSPTALKRRRESFSRRAWSDVVADNDSGMVQTPTTHSPFMSGETSPPHLWNSVECSRDLGCLRMRSISLDTGLSHEEEDRRWECALWAGTQRCFYCGSPISYDNSWAKTRPEVSSDLPYSLDELEDMMKCLRKFRTVLTEIEGRLEEEQASVLGSMSDSHREEVEDVLRLRSAVKQEAGVLEQQLSDLVHHYDDSIKMKLNRLLDEQSDLCSQLRITPSDTPSSEAPSTKSVAIQCCLPLVTSSPQRCCHHHCTCHTHQRTWQDPHRSPYQTQWDSHFRPDGLDFVAFLKSLKNSLQLSIKNSSLE